MLAEGYEEYLKAEFLNADARVEDVQQLAQYARGYEDTEAFLAEIALLTELSAETVAEGVRHNWSRPAALLLVVGFGMVLITYSGSLWFSGLHAYSGL